MVNLQLSGFIQVPAFFSTSCFKLNTSQSDMQTNLHSQGEQVLLRELQVVVITEPPQHGPCGLVPTSLYEEGVQEEEACN